jgi:hypothetical protein
MGERKQDCFPQKIHARCKCKPIQHGQIDRANRALGDHRKVVGAREIFSHVMITNIAIISVHATGRAPISKAVQCTGRDKVQAPGEIEGGSRHGACATIWNTMEGEHAEVHALRETR